MVNWTEVPLDYEPLAGSNDVFVTSTSVFQADSLGKITPARGRERQAHFERQLRHIAWHLGSRTVPVFLSFNGERRRMDKGCVGLAVTAGVLESPIDGPEGFLTHVTLTATPRLSDQS